MQVVLITVDGLRPEYYLDASWPAPAMQQLYRDGAHARAVTSVFPSLTYPGHTTLITGALPARHGVCHNRVIESDPNPRWLTDASVIRVPTLWDAVRARGGSVAAVAWPMTVGAAIDWNLPDIWPRKEEDVVPAIRKAANPPGLFDEVEREAVGRLNAENFSSRILAHDLRVASIARYLFERYHPTLLLAHTQATVQVFQEPDGQNPRRPRAVAASDQVVSMMVETVERKQAWDRTTVIVAGDHGMTEVHSQIRPNVWLIEAGLRGPNLQTDDWRATFHALGGSAFLRVREPADQNVEAVRQVLTSRENFRIVEKEELTALGSDPEAPLALAAASGFVIDDRVEPPAMQPNPGMSHGHHPDHPDMKTGLVAFGAGIRKGACAPTLPLTAIAPLIAELLGLDFTAPDGVLYRELLG